jgi:phage-related minor tail protein
MDDTKNQRSRPASDPLSGSLAVALAAFGGAAALVEGGLIGVEGDESHTRTRTRELLDEPDPSCDDAAELLGLANVIEDRAASEERIARDLRRAAELLAGDAGKLRRLAGRAAVKAGAKLEECGENE